MRLGIFACSCRIASLASFQFLTGKDLPSLWHRMDGDAIEEWELCGKFWNSKGSIGIWKGVRKVWGKKVDAIMRELREIGSAESGCSRKVAQDERCRVSSTTGKMKSIPILGNNNLETAGRFRLTGR